LAATSRLPKIVSGTWCPRIMAKDSEEENTDDPFR
jgi:hypothetical protein